MMKEDKKNRRSIRAQAFEESNYPTEVGGLRCVEVMIPDSVEFMAQLAGVVALATKQFNYQNKDTARAAAITKLWRDAYLATDWEGCMSCEDVADCIENSEAVHEKLTNWLNANYNFAASDYPPNIPLPSDQRLADRAGIFNPSCDLDVLWAQCIQLVGWMNDRISDTLEIIEAATNSWEVAGAVTQITGLDEASVDALFSYGGLLQDFIAENYAAAYTTAYRDELACEIFCAAQNDCEISLEDLFNIFKVRVETYFSTSSTFAVLDDVIDYLLGQSINDQIVVDAAFFLLWGGITLANWIVGGLTNDMEIGTKVLNLLLKLAVNDANNDWELLCEDCTAPSAIVLDVVPLDSRVVFNTDGGAFGGSGSRVLNAPADITITLAVAEHIQSVTFAGAFFAEFGHVVTINGIDYDLVRGAFIGGSTYQYTATIPNISATVILINMSAGGVVADITINVI